MDIQELKCQILDEIKIQNMDTFSDFVEKNRDFKLYKYRSGSDYDISAFKSQKLWMGCAAYMGDPNDSAYIPTEDLSKIYKWMCSEEPKFRKKSMPK